MKRPIIVLSTAEASTEVPFPQKYYFSNIFNTTAITKAGGLPVIAPYLDEAGAEALLERTDGLFLTGGGDIDPILYGEAPSSRCSRIDPNRDRSDYHLLQAALKLHKPVLCICRGFQLANVFFGGTLYQDIPTQYETTVHHAVAVYPDYTQERTHAVSLVAGSPLQQLLGTTDLMVNSLHHQAIRKLASPLRPMAYAEDGILESWYLPGSTQWLWGMQWHPEMLASSPRGEAVFLEFLRQCQLSSL